MKICYSPKKFSKGHENTIRRANDILETYLEQGFVLTLRQLYYQFIARDYFPNTLQSYKMLSKVIGDARLAGRIDWDMIEDRIRNLSALQHFNSGKDAIEKVVGWYHINMWDNQTHRPEVWIEKDALSGVISRVCRDHDVPYFSCRGYTSLSEMYRASCRLKSYEAEGKQPFIIHLGDHDPSGMDMSRDIIDRLGEVFGANFSFVRVALNMDQIEELNPPPNWAKVTDSRFQKYKDEYGDQSWELDALEPARFRDLIEDQLSKFRNDSQWKKDERRRDQQKLMLKTVRDDWDVIPERTIRLRELEKRVPEIEQELDSERKKVLSLGARVKELEKKLKGKKR